MEKRGAASTYIAVFMGIVALVVTGGAIGFVVRDETSNPPTTTTHARAENVKASDVGNAVAGRAVYTSAGCVACHSYKGAGGKDGPPLDFMRGKLAVSDLATMTGRIWNHVPLMQKLFKEEGIPFPNFTGTEMADLVAYIHGGGPAPAPRAGTMAGG